MHYIFENQSCLQLKIYDYFGHVYGMVYNSWNIYDISWAQGNISMCILGFRGKIREKRGKPVQRERSDYHTQIFRIPLHVIFVLLSCMLTTVPMKNLKRFRVLTYELFLRLDTHVAWKTHVILMGIPWKIQLNYKLVWILFCCSDRCHNGTTGVFPKLYHHWEWGSFKHLNGDNGQYDWTQSGSRS